MGLSEILNLVLGGGLLAAVVGLLTLKATVRKANAEAEKARAEAETVRIDNTEQATRILIDNIVEPLKKELNETREELRATKKEFGSTKREMARLRKAIGDAGNCKHSDACPVLFRLREHPKDSEGDLPDGGESDDGGQYGQRSPPCTDGGGPEVGGTAGDTG